MPTLKLSDKEWNKIKLQIEKDYGQTVLLLSWRLKSELGFAVRYHRYWKNDDGPAGEYDGYGQYIQEVHLDFDTEKNTTFFRLKYL